MKRRAARRDAWLSARMLIVVVLLGAATVGAIAGAIGLLMLVSGIWVVYGLLVLYAVVALAVAQCRSASATMLRAVGARELLEDEEPELQAAVARLAALADASPPKIAIAQLDRPNSLTVGVRPRNTTIVVSRGLLELLPPAERDAVLAHELAHVLNRDAAVMSAAGLSAHGRADDHGAAVRGRCPVDVHLVPRHPAVDGWVAVDARAVPLPRVRRRPRLCAADRCARAAHERAPEARGARRRDSDRGSPPPRRLEALCIVPNRRVILTAFADHPSLEKRLATLASIAREMGRPV